MSKKLGRIATENKRESMGKDLLKVRGIRDSYRNLPQTTQITEQLDFWEHLCATWTAEIIDFCLANDLTPLDTEEEKESES